MQESEPVTSPTRSQESVLYAQLFSEWLPGMRSFLDYLFASFFQTWGAMTLVPNEDAGKDYHNFTNFAPFCKAIHSLDLRKKTCLQCDQRKEQEVAKSRKPLPYWCDWGLREIIVPILIHDVSVGVILCGQKRLEGIDDLEGRRQLEKFAANNGIEDLLPELCEQRSLCKAVSPSQETEMVKIVWATSQFISQLLYNKLDETTGSARAASDALEDLFAGFGKLDDDRTSPAHFWDALDKQLHNLSTTFDSRCIAVVLETDGNYRVVASHGLGRAILQTPPKAHLISSTMRNFTLPEHLELTGQSFPDCFLTSQVRDIYPFVNMVVFDKARLGDDRVLHLLVYFDPTVPRHYRLFLHQKKQALSLFLRETANSFLHAERVEQLRKTLADEDALLQNVVHQINQPLHGILADCQNLVRTGYPQDRKDKIIKYLPHRAKQLTMLVKSVQYAGHEGIPRSANEEPFNVNLSKLLIETSIDLQGYAEERTVRIEVDTAVSDSLGEVLIDREDVEMALTNVVYNAVKYAFPGTTVKISSEVANRLLRILVTDHGIGIEPSERESVFSKHKRTEQAKSFSQSGLGIGLFVTRELMRSMGGDAVVVESSPTGRTYKQFCEHRTTIALTLPRSVVLKSGGTN
jgi:signal transduction histidine kinase/ligand-binding sensor protein